MVEVVCKECVNTFSATSRRFKYCEECRYIVERRKAREHSKSWLTPAKRKEYNERRREYAREYAKQYRENNPDYQSEYRSSITGKAKRASVEAKRRAQRYTTEIETINLIDVWIAEKGICWLCLRPVPLEDAEIEHVHPLSRGGTHTKENISVAHSRCNRIKSNKISSDLYSILELLRKGD